MCLLLYPGLSGMGFMILFQGTGMPGLAKEKPAGYPSPGGKKDFCLNGVKEIIHSSFLSLQRLHLPYWVFRNNHHHCHNPGGEAGW
jgi:hypothetical protein